MPFSGYVLLLCNTATNTKVKYTSPFTPKVKPVLVQGAVPSLIQFLTIESRLKMKNAFYSKLKALLILKIFKFLS